MLIHLDDAEFGKAVRRLARALRPGARSRSRSRNPKTRRCTMGASFTSGVPEKRARGSVRSGCPGSLRNGVGNLARRGRRAGSTRPPGGWALSAAFKRPARLQPSSNERSCRIRPPPSGEVMLHPMDRRPLPGLRRLNTIALGCAANGPGAGPARFRVRGVARLSHRWPYLGVGCL